MILFFCSCKSETELKNATRETREAAQMQKRYPKFAMLVVTAALTMYPLAGTANEPSIFDAAYRTEGLGKLVEMLGASDLADVLPDDGPYTVFAPTLEALAALAPGFMESLVDPENRDMLIAILCYHVVPGVLTAADAAVTVSAATVNGTDVRLSFEDGVFTVNQARVIATDITLPNGVIHLIDTVLQPPLG